jgi:hypothetical protein
MSILLRYGNGSFALIKRYFYEQILSISSVVVDDFNGDQYLDIVQTDFGNGDIIIYLRYGNASFEYLESYSYPFFALVDDFNNDKYLDIATANLGTDNVGIFLGYENGSFTKQRAYATGDASLSIYVTAGNINNDNCCGSCRC